LDRKRYLHVANGTSTTRTIAAAGIPGELSIWADPLHDGPVPGGFTDEELVEARTTYLAGLSVEPVSTAAATGGEATEAREATENTEHTEHTKNTEHTEHTEHTDERTSVNDLRRWRAAITARDDWDELVLWYEHDLFDQLNLIQLLTWISSRIGADAPVSLICIGSYPGRPNFKGLGELSPGELAPLFETRTPVSNAQYDFGDRAWAAFRAPTPEDLDAISRGDTSALPYLGAALARLLEEYPWTSDGLSRSERRLLELSAHGTTLREAFPRMHDGETAYYIADGTLAALAAELSSTTPPLLDTDSRGSIRLSAAGKNVLDGRQDRIALCGIDRWIGGVHLRAGHIWRWNDPGIIPGSTFSSAPGRTR
jgi:hypothetical protein